MKLQRGIQPFWFWNGDMNSDEIVRQIGEMHSQGIPGFLIHPRQGMEVPYLSEAFFDRVEVAVEAAKARGMEVWLYDEYPYPSGTSGGKVMLDHPEYRCVELQRVEHTAKPGETVKLHAPWGKVVLARAYRVRNGVCDWNDFIPLEGHIGTGYTQEVFQFSGLTKYNSKRFFTGDASQYLYWTAPADGEYKIHLFVECVMEHFKYFEYFIDPLNPAAVRYYLDTTHELYRKRFASEFGVTIKGVFTDETTPFPPGQPWSPLLPGLVREHHGIDLVDSLPRLFAEDEDNAALRYAFWDSATEGFIQSYDRQIYDWCEENGLLYIGEKPILRSSQLRFMHIGGIDAGHQKVGSKAKMIEPRYRGNGKIASSAAHFYGKPAVLCEAFHSIGWGMTLQDMKWIFDWLAAAGVDWFVVHGFFFSTDALKKHDAPPSGFYQMPWWKHMRELEAYAEALGNFLQNNERRVPLLVLDPATSTWTGQPERNAKLSEDFAAMQTALLEAQVDYYIIDPQLFAEAKVERLDGVIAIVVNGEAFTTLALPPMVNLEALTLPVLREYAEQGGRIAAMGSLPFEQIDNGDASALFRELFGVEPEETGKAYLAGKPLSAQKDGCRLAPDAASLAAFLREELPPAWRIDPADGKSFEDLASIQATSPDGTPLLFVANLADAPRSLILTMKGESQPLELAPLESRILRGGEAVANPKADYVLPLDGEWNIKLDSPNALRVALWEMELPDGQQATVDSFPFIDQMEAAGLALPVQQKKWFGCPKELDFSGLAAAYRFAFDWEPAAGPVWLVMEPGTLLGDWTLEINGAAIAEKQFGQREFYLPTNLAVEVTGLLKAGENRMELHVSSELSYGGIRNPLYLMGGFGVEKGSERWALKEWQGRGPIKDTLAAGIPFYAGTVTYSKTVDALLAGRDSLIAVEDVWFQDSAELLVNGNSCGYRAWSPYRYSVPTSAVKSENEVALRVDTTLIGLFEGEYFDREQHKYEKYEK